MAEGQMAEASQKTNVSAELVGLLFNGPCEASQRTKVGLISRALEAWLDASDDPSLCAANKRELLDAAPIVEAFLKKYQSTFHQALITDEKKNDAGALELMERLLDEKAATDTGLHEVGKLEEEALELLVKELALLDEACSKPRVLREKVVKQMELWNSEIDRHVKNGAEFMSDVSEIMRGLEAELLPGDRTKMLASIRKATEDTMNEIGSAKTKLEMFDAICKQNPTFQEICRDIKFLRNMLVASGGDAS